MKCSSTGVNNISRANQWLPVDQVGDDGKKHSRPSVNMIAIKIRLGRYAYGGEQDSHPYFKQLDVGTPNYLYYLEWLGVW